MRLLYLVGDVTKQIIFVIVDHPRTVHSGTFISLTVSVTGIVLTEMSSGEMISKHDMQGISFASGGEKVFHTFQAFYKDENMSANCNGVGRKPRKVGVESEVESEVETNTKNLSPSSIQTEVQSFLHEAKTVKLTTVLRHVLQYI